MTFLEDRRRIIRKADPMALAQVLRDTAAELKDTQQMDIYNAANTVTLVRNRLCRLAEEVEKLRA